MRMLVALMFTLLSGVALAQSPIALSPPVCSGPREGCVKALEETETTNVTGTCGSAIVRVLGLTGVYDDPSSFHIDLDAGMILIRQSASRERILTPKNSVLSDENGIACVATKAGPRLLVWGKSGGSCCYEMGHEFMVIDPNSLTTLAPGDPKRRCDAKCASRALGDKLPLKIDGAKH